MSRIRLVEAMNPFDEGDDHVADMRRALLSVQVGRSFHLTEERRGTPFHELVVVPSAPYGTAPDDAFSLTLQTCDPAGPLVERWYGPVDAVAEAVAHAFDALDGARPSHEIPTPDAADLVAEGLAWSILDGMGDAVAIIRRATPWSPASIVVGSLGEPEPSVFLGAPDRRLADWIPHHPRDGTEMAALDAMRRGTLVQAHHKRPRLAPDAFRISTVDSDPIARMRAIAAWAAFRDARR